MPDIAAAAGYAECDDFDQTADLEATRDGSAIFASLPLTGLSRIRPTPLPISPDIIDYFQVHPDGSIIYVTTSDAVGTGSLNIFKISPEQAVAASETAPPAGTPRSWWRAVECWNEYRRRALREECGELLA